MKILKIVPSKFFFLVSTLLIAALSFGASTAVAQSNAQFAATPVTTQEFVTPQVMLSLSADHQYFFAAYSDFSDLDPDSDTGGDGPEVTYENNIEYFGYFDPNKCYSYNTATERFVPEANQITEYYCNDVGGDWSGNFLNWATMTRMDVVRKIFYGGFRSTDTNDLTVLERAHLPFDAHSFAKYYNGTDIADLTPFDSSNITIGDGQGEDGRFEGITICNTSPDNGNALSETSAAAPVMRVVRGNFSLWAANERWQCTWSNENGNQDNGNQPQFSLINASDQDPSRAANGDALRTSAGQEDRIVRVEVCNTLMTELNGEGCRQYPDGNFKPTGLLHEFGQDGEIEFGLMTGGFQANTEGGILRKNIRPFTDEVNVDTDGTFTKNAFGVRVPGIVTNLDALRMVGYRYDNGTYFGGGSPDNCNFQQVDIQPNECFSWGNPISEILLESVNYLSGGTETAAFDVDDEPRLQGIVNRGGGIEAVPGLSSEDWIDVLNADNQCADVTQIVINASVSSFDENFASAAALPGAPNIDTFTNNVGNIEGISGNSFFVGSTAGNDNELCTAKTVNNLSEVRGICPEAPTVAGSFGAAGIAFYAAITDLRPGLEGDQHVQTLGITLATNQAVIEVPLGPVGTLESINILPAYRLLAQGGVTEDGGGALVDFRIVQGHQETDVPGVFSGVYYLNWEDSEQGGDFDNDVWGTIGYVLDTNTPNNTITITTNAVTQRGGGRPQLFGFITSGTTQDGFHAFSGVLGATRPADGAIFVDPVAGAVPGCVNCRAGSEGGGQTGPQSHTFIIDQGAVAAETLQPPLYYAAKYGSFDESNPETSNQNNEPDLVSEFDVENNFTGLAGADGIPDGYFAATSPDTLIDAVRRALDRALSFEDSSGSAPANLGNSDGDGDLVVQALFFEAVDGDNVTFPSEVSWSGDIRGFFLDSNGFLREDSDDDDELDPSNVDNIIQFNNDGESLMIDRQSFANEDDFDEFDPNGLSDEESVDPDEINPIWSAAENLSMLDNDDIVTNRAYGDPVSETGASRFINTWIDANDNGRVDADEYVPFEAGEVDGDFEAFLASTAVTPLFTAADTTADAVNIINFIRGFEDYVDPGDAGTNLATMNGFRSRTTLVGGEAGTDRLVHRLGDVISSTTVIVGPPTEDFEVTFGDATYAEFRTKYANRRTMVYTGANDGLLHAFNAGFRGETVDTPVLFTESGISGVETEHPLGAEIWAYAPNNLLPHLQWLTSSEYLHTFYMDGEPAVFDVNIFTDDTGPNGLHPGGWGTILVAGMGLGGGDFNIGDVNGDGDNQVTRSAYVVFDITNPEQEPVLLGEITHEDLDHTTVRPTIVRNRVANDGINFANTSSNETKLVFASGPDNRVDFTSSNTAKVFTVDLTLLAGVIENTEPTVQEVTASQNAFVGGISTADWNEDFVDDVVYFGTVEQGAALTDQSGDIYRFLPQSGQINTFFAIDRPITSTPIPLVVDGANFVYAGTGRYLDQSDAITAEQQYFVGIIEEETGFTATFNLGSLLDVTDIDIIQNFDATGEITSVIAENGTAGLASNQDGGGDNAVTTFEELSEFILEGVGGRNGWVRYLGTDVLPTEGVDASGDPIVTDDGVRPISERVISDADTFFPVISWATFVPEERVCVPEIGEAFGYVADLVTGTSSELAPLVARPATGAAGSREAGIGFRIGFGIPSDTNIIGTESGDAVILNGTSQGDISRQFLGLAQPGELRRVNWREILQ